MTNTVLPILACATILVTPVLVRGAEIYQTVYMDAMKADRESAWNPWSRDYMQKHLPPMAVDSAYKGERLVSQKKDYLAGADAFEALKAEFPDASVQAYASLMKGLCLQRAKDYPGAIKAYQVVMADYGKSAEIAPAALYHLADVYFDIGDKEAGMAALKMLVENDSYRKHPMAEKAAKQMKYGEKVGWSTFDVLKKTRQPVMGGALGLLFLNEHVDVANKMVVDYCKPNPKDPKNNRFGRCEALLRIYLQDDIRARLTPEAKKAIEDVAWFKVTEKQSSLRTYWEAMSSEDHFLNNRRIYYLSLRIVRMSPRYGPKAVVRYHGGRSTWSKVMETTVEERYQPGLSFGSSTPATGPCMVWTWRPHRIPLMAPVRSVPIWIFVTSPMMTNCGVLPTTS